MIEFDKMFDLSRLDYDWLRIVCPFLCLLMFFQKLIVIFQINFLFQFFDYFSLLWDWRIWWWFFMNFFLFPLWLIFIFFMTFFIFLWIDIIPLILQRIFRGKFMKRRFWIVILFRLVILSFLMFHNLRILHSFIGMVVDLRAGIAKSKWSIGRIRNMLIFKRRMMDIMNLVFSIRN